MVTGFVDLLYRHDSQTEGIANPESSCGIDMLASTAADLDLEPISRSEVVDGCTSNPIWGDAQAADVPKSGHGETNPSPWQSSGCWKRRNRSWDGLKARAMPSKMSSTESCLLNSEGKNTHDTFAPVVDMVPCSVSSLMASQAVEMRTLQVCYSLTN